MRRSPAEQLMAMDFPLDTPERPRQASSYENPGLTFDDATWDEAMLAPRPWIAPGYLLRGSVTVLVGAGSAGKSSLAVSWSVALALCEQFHRFVPNRSCRVLSYNVEDDQDEQRRRYSAALRSFNRKPADIQRRVVRVHSARIGTLIGRTDYGLVFTPAMEALEERVRQFRPDVLMLDPLVELHDAEENDNTAVRAVMAHFRALAVEHDLALVLLHHTRKGSAAAAGDPDVSRGASAVVSAARVVMTVTTMTPDEGQSFGIPEDRRSLFFRLDGAKINAAPLQGPEWFEKMSHHLENGDRVMAATPWQPPEDVIDTQQRTAIRADLEIGSAEGPWSPKLSRDARSVRQLLVRHGVKTARGQTGLLNEFLTTGGFEIATFRRASRSTGQGIRSADRRPSNVNWVESPENADAE